MTDYGRIEATPTNSDRTFGSDNACFMVQIDIPNGTTIGSLTWYPGATVGTCKYRVVGYLRSGLYTCSGASVIDAPEVTGTTAHTATTITLTTPYTNSSGSTKSIYFGINYIVARPGVMGYTESAIECPVFANGGTDVPPSGPTLTPNSNVYALYVSTGAVQYTGTVTKGSFTFAGKTILTHLGHTSAMARGVFTFTGKAVDIHKHLHETMVAGGYLLAGQTIRLSRLYRRLIAVGEYILTPGWHSVRLDDTASTTNRRVNRRWWGKLLNGRGRG